MYLSILYLIKSPFRRVFQQQIANIILVYNNDIYMLLMNEYTLKVSKHLSVIGCAQFLSINNPSSTTWLSLNVNKLCC